MKSIDRIITQAPTNIRYLANQVLIFISTIEAMDWDNQMHHNLHNEVVATTRPHIKNDDLTTSDF